LPEGVKSPSVEENPIYDFIRKTVAHIVNGGGFYMVKTRDSDGRVVFERTEEKSFKNFIIWKEVTEAHKDGSTNTKKIKSNGNLKAELELIQVRFYTPKPHSLSYRLIIG